MSRKPPYLNLILFVATVASTWLVAADPKLEALPAFVFSGMPYALALMGILLTHEMGHYLFARYYKVDTSLPYFIPMPLGYPGTLGAVISMSSRIPSRRAVLDIGVAGPLAGFAVALPLLFWGFAHSPVIPLLGNPRPNAVFQCPFNILMGFVEGKTMRWHPTGDSMEMGDSILTWLAARLTHGPLDAHSDIQLGAVGMAAWFGLLVTMLNLTPVGQLDGGHVIYALFGRWAELVSRLFSWALLGLGFFASWNWFVWWALTRFLIGVKHPPALDEAPLSPARRAVAILSLVILVLTFVPVPVYM